MSFLGILFLIYVSALGQKKTALPLTETHPKKPAGSLRNTQDFNSAVFIHVAYAFEIF